MNNSDGIKETIYSIVIPAFNEELAIGPVLKSLKQISTEFGIYEIIVVNDGSSDQTSEIVKNIPDVHLIEHKMNRGYGAALKSGIRFATGKYIILCDADGQHSLNDIQKIMTRSHEYDMVVGKRVKGSFVQKNRIVGKKVIVLIANYLVGENIPDINSGLRSLKREKIIKYLHLLPDSFSASTTCTMIFLMRSHDICWVPIRTLQRQGTSSVKQIHHGLYTLVLIFRIITLFHPLKIFFPVAFLISSFGMLWGIAYLQNGGLTVFGGILILSGLIIFMFGILFDQVSQLRLEKYE